MKRQTITAVSLVINDTRPDNRGGEVNSSPNGRAYGSGKCEEQFAAR
jgi:hypothetical protein